MRGDVAQASACEVLNFEGRLKKQDAWQGERLRAKAKGKKQKQKSKSYRLKPVLPRPSRVFIDSYKIWKGCTQEFVRIARYPPKPPQNVAFIEEDLQD